MLVVYPESLPCWDFPLSIKRRDMTPVVHALKMTNFWLPPAAVLPASFSENTPNPMKGGKRKNAMRITMALHCRQGVS
jgi:hypothetical protein